MADAIALLGLGKMGRGLAKNLAAAGFPLRVWNRSPGKADPAWHAQSCASPREAALGAAIVISMLADDAAVEASVLGEGGALAGMDPGAIHVDMGTTSLALVQRLGRLHAEHGTRFAAAPVFGRPEAAEKRQLFIVAGGAPAVLERCAPVLGALSRAIFPVESPEQAIAVKLCGNFLIAATLEGLAEALALGEKAGVAPERLVEILTGTLFGSPIVKGYGERMARGEYQPAGFDMRLGLKDLGLVLQAGEAVGAQLPLANLVRDQLMAGIAQGRGDQDWAALADVVRVAAGLPPRVPPAA